MRAETCDPISRLCSSPFLLHEPGAAFRVFASRDTTSSTRISSSLGLVIMVVAVVVVIIPSTNDEKEKGGGNNTSDDDKPSASSSTQPNTLLSAPNGSLISWGTVSSGATSFGTKRRQIGGRSSLLEGSSLR